MEPEGTSFDACKRAASFKSKALAQLGRRDYWEWYEKALAEEFQEAIDEAIEIVEEEL